ncbi:MAG: KOW domain-containing RNA-binding protein [Oscillospiraceae bacterium]|nr:KOW domain-containing RNA-binding protein [Oscillospiraceae bacterium]
MQRQICQPGTVVLAKAGRDAGRFFLVAALDGADLLLADGDRRKLHKPKRKNPLHVQATKTVLPLEALTDKALRLALKPLNEAAKAPKPKLNQIRKEVIDDVETGCN